MLSVRKTLLKVLFADILAYSLLPLRVLQGYYLEVAVRNVPERSHAAYAQHLNVPTACANRADGLTK